MTKGKSKVNSQINSGTNTNTNANCANQSKVTQYCSQASRRDHGLDTFSYCSICKEDVENDSDILLCNFCGHGIYCSCSSLTPEFF